MSNDLRFPSPDDKNSARDRDALEESLVQVIRAAYAPPVQRDYWRGLEQRIMARVASAGTPGFGDPADGWWLVLGGWARAGLVAAAAVFVFASVVNSRLGESDAQVAYESAWQASSPEGISPTAALLAARNGTAGRDAALGYVLSY